MTLERADGMRPNLRSPLRCSFVLLLISSPCVGAIVSNLFYKIDNNVISVWWRNVQRTLGTECSTSKNTIHCQQHDSISYASRRRQVFQWRNPIFVACIIPIRFSNDVSNVHTLRNKTNTRIVNVDMHFRIEFSELHYARSADFRAHRIFRVNKLEKNQNRNNNSLKVHEHEEKKKKIPNIFCNFSADLQFQVEQQAIDSAKCEINENENEKFIKSAHACDIINCDFFL